MPRKKISDNNKPAKSYMAMNAAELREATAEFDQEFVADSFGRPSAAQAAQLRRARRKRGRPRSGQGSQTICVTIEKGLLAQADRLANDAKVSRSAIIAQGLRAVLKQTARHERIAQ